MAVIITGIVPLLLRDGHRLLSFMLIKQEFLHMTVEKKNCEVHWSQYRNVQLDSVNFKLMLVVKQTIAFQPDLIPIVTSPGLGNGTAKLINSIPRESK